MAFVCMLPALAAGEPTTTPKSAGLSIETAVIDGGQIRVHIYRPKSCGKAPRPLLLVFAGYERNAEEYVRRARPVARARCMTVIAPELDEERFPRAHYQRAGVSRRTGDRACMGRLLRGLQAWARDREGQPDAPFVLFGHSAGGQMLSRVSAYCPLPDVERIIIANPSSHVAASLIEPAPFGFASLLGVQEREADLARYLRQPITIYLGEADTGDVRLDKSPGAQRQGRTRLERGRNVFAAAQAMAATRGWPFRWRLVVAAGVGHSSRNMLRAPEMTKAIALEGQHTPEW